MSDKLNEVKVSEANDLMRPRYKCIVRYPMMDTAHEWKVGSIIQLTIDEFTNKMVYETRDGGYISQSFFEEYPQIFKPLQWWEERKQGDVQFVKDRYGVYKIKKVEAHRDTGYGHIYFGKKGGIGLTMNYEPSTLTDYNNFLTTKKQV